MSRRAPIETNVLHRMWLLFEGRHVEAGTFLGNDYLEEK
jgi:hypothetical protein